MARILLIDTVYPAFIRWLYQAEPELAAESHAVQLRRATDTGYHNVSVWADPLRLLGHEVCEVWANHAPLQRAWCREQGRLDLIPGATASDMVLGAMPTDWFLPICAAQVRAFRPDILWLADLYTFHDGFLSAVEGHYRHAIGQNAAVPPTTPLRRLDVAVSASDCILRHFRDQGLAAELLPHGFNPRILHHLPDPPEPPARPLGFFGSLHPAHRGRESLLLDVARRMPIEIWTEAALPPAFAGSQAKRHPALWGGAMHAEAARTATVLNSHLDGTGDWATNQRLYEVTGCGAALLTDRKSNLAELFVPGRECVAYDSAEDCAEKARWLAEHPAERAEIAERGQRRTLTDHTVFQRGLRIQEILATHGMAA
ncbi:MAG: glycosyltransferase [Pseudomonadota bacterium]